MSEYAINILNKELASLEEKMNTMKNKKVGEQHSGFNTFSDVFRVMSELEEDMKSLRIAIRNME